MRFKTDGQPESYRILLTFPIAHSPLGGADLPSCRCVQFHQLPLKLLIKMHLWILDDVIGYLSYLQNSLGNRLNVINTLYALLPTGIIPASVTWFNTTSETS